MIKVAKRAQLIPDRTEKFQRRVRWFAANGSEQTSSATPALKGAELHLALPARIGHQYRQRRNYSGKYVFSQTGKALWYESMFELSALKFLDYSCDYKGLATQPMLLQFAGSRSHYPDFFGLHRDGTQVVYDVRPLELIDERAEETFQETREFCAAIGWEYEVISELPQALRGNLDLLASRRHSRYAPAEDLRQAVLEFAAVSRTFHELHAQVSSWHPLAASSTIYAMLWRRDLRFDLEHPLTLSTPVWGAVQCGE